MSKIVIVLVVTSGFDREHTLELDQTPAFDPAEPEPDLEFHQSRGG